MFFLHYLCTLKVINHAKRMKRNRKLILFIAVLLMLPTLALWSQKRFVFTPQWKAQAQFAGYYVAQEKGFYKEEGIDVDIVHPSATQSALSRVEDDDIDATTLQLCQAMKIVDSGVPLINILQTSMNNALVIVSRRGKNPLEQKGERVGIWKADFGEMAMCMSQKEGLGYEWVYYASEMNLFIRGAIDAIVAMSYNEYYQLLQTGIQLKDENVYRFCDHEYNVQEDGVYMRRDTYERNKEQADKFARASQKGWEWAAEHPEETLDIVMKYVKLNHVATNRTLQKLMLDEVLRLQTDRETGKREFRLRPDMVKLASSLLLENRVLKHEVTYTSLVNSEK